MTAINKSPTIFSSSIQHLWRPSVDGNFIARHPYVSVRNGQFTKVFTLHTPTVRNETEKAFSDRFRW
jgi:hypothetical protein